MRLVSVFVFAVLVSGLAAAAPVPTTCGMPGDYSAALCAYQKRDFKTAESSFRVIVERGEETAETLHATYFLARTLMKRGQFDEAAKLFIRIYSLDKPFYDGWNCDFLLGECRRARGEE